MNSSLDVDLYGVVGQVVDVEVEGGPLDENPVFHRDDVQAAFLQELRQLHEVHGGDANGIGVQKPL